MKKKQHIEEIEKEFIKDFNKEQFDKLNEIKIGPVYRKR